MNENFSCFTSSPILGMVSYFNFNHCVRWVVVSLVALICTYLMTNDDENLLIFLFVIPRALWWSFLPFKKKWYCFPIIEFKEFIEYSGYKHHILSVQFSSVTQSWPTVCDPMNRSTPGLPVHHQLPEFTQTHAHRVGDAIQPSHPLFPPSSPVLNPSQHQGLFQWVNSSNEVAKVLEFHFQHQSFQCTPRTDWLYLLAVQGTLKSLHQHHSSKASIFQHSAFFTVQDSYPYMTTGKTIAWPDGPLLAK